MHDSDSDEDFQSVSNRHSAKDNGADLLGGMTHTEDTADLLNMGGGNDTADNLTAGVNLLDMNKQPSDIDLLSGRDFGKPAGQNDAFGLFQSAGEQDGFGDFASFGNTDTSNSAGLDLLNNKHSEPTILQPESTGGTAGSADDFFGGMDANRANSASQQFKSSSQSNLLGGWDLGGGSATFNLGGSQSSLDVNPGSGSNLNLRAGGSQGSLNLGSNFPAMGNQANMTPSPLGQKCDPFADLGQLHSLFPNAKKLVNICMVLNILFSGSFGFKKSNSTSGFGSQQKTPMASMGRPAGSNGGSPAHTGGSMGGASGPMGANKSWNSASPSHKPQQPNYSSKCASYISQQLLPSLELSYLAKHSP